MDERLIIVRMAVKRWFRRLRLVRSRTSGSHPGNTGSNPVGVTN